MSKIKLSLDVVNPSEFHNLGIELWLDQTKFFDDLVSPGTHHVIHEFEDGETTREFRIILKNKTDEHTQIDDSGNILNDVMITVNNINVDDINIDQLMWHKAEYLHTGNGSYEMKSHKFYGNLGCNGTVFLEFSTPFYLWLLENM